MTCQLRKYAKIMCVGALLTGSSPSIAAPDVVPKLNTRPSCESPALLRLTHGRHSTEACMASEKEAHEFLVKHWVQYSKIDKTNCIGNVTQGGPPSYIELHSCLDTMRHARIIRERHRR